MSGTTPPDGQVLAAVLEILDSDPKPSIIFDAPAISLNHLATNLHIIPSSIDAHGTAELIRPLAETIFDKPREPVVHTLRKGLGKEHWIVFRNLNRDDRPAEPDYLLSASHPMDYHYQGDNLEHNRSEPVAGENDSSERSTNARQQPHLPRPPIRRSRTPTLTLRMNDIPPPLPTAPLPSPPTKTLRLLPTEGGRGDAVQMPLKSAGEEGKGKRGFLRAIGLGRKRDGSRTNTPVANVQAGSAGHGYAQSGGTSDRTDVNSQQAARTEWERSTLDGSKERVEHSVKSDGMRREDDADDDWRPAVRSRRDDLDSGLLKVPREAKADRATEQSQEDDEEEYEIISSYGDEDNDADGALEDSNPNRVEGDAAELGLSSTGHRRPSHDEDDSRIVLDGSTEEPSERDKERTQSVHEIQHLQSEVQPGELEEETGHPDRHRQPKHRDGDREATQKGDTQPAHLIKGNDQLPGRGRENILDKGEEANEGTRHDTLDGSNGMEDEIQDDDVTETKEKYDDREDDWEEENKSPKPKVKSRGEDHKGQSVDDDVKHKRPVRDSKDDDESDKETTERLNDDEKWQDDKAAQSLEVEKQDSDGPISHQLKDDNLRRRHRHRDEHERERKSRDPRRHHHSSSENDEHRRHSSSHHDREDKHKKSDETRHKRHRLPVREGVKVDEEAPPTPWLITMFEDLPFGPDIPALAMVDWLKDRWQLIAAEVVATLGVVYIIQATGL
ncbi:hypothetical protein CI109_103283 [Kwoniella shandongensis]|uniref:Uncharacterized protein n=1 Tax=Kwoniella shandongensis TaxID=1734106 RepID=A0A5M6BRS0_9TREE|nr:uncharacterized protein CI109_006045 [Kwoniella shandongensis]KAA5525594.1 hypothetical protein CI109_006045 [Kwoniella shandongensis]